MFYSKPILAQNYKNAIGVRGGYASGITFKHFFSESEAFEAILHTRYSGFLFTGLYEKHQQAFNTQNLYWFYGAGAHVGTFGSNSRFRDRNGDPYGNDVTTFGIDGILGLEYQIKEIPFTISVDLKPHFGIINPGRNFWGGGLSIRYAF